MQLVEARLVWGSDVLGVAHVGARRGLCLADFGLALPDDFAEDEAVDIDALPRTFRAASGGLEVRLALVEGEKPIPAAKSDWRIAKGVALGFVIHATFLTMAFIGRGSDAELERAQLEALKTMLEKDMPKRVVMKVQLPWMPDDENVGAGSGTDEGMSTSPREEGAMGNPASQQNRGVARRSHGSRAQETDPRPEPSVESFGMIALLSEHGYGKNAGNDPWSAHDGPSAMGNIFGASIDDAIGVGGMGLSNFGEGGGGKGAGVGFEGASGSCGPGCIGTIGGGNGVAQGFGVGVGRLGGGHRTRSPVIRCGEETCTTQVNGRLPPETVQRVVRQNFGRLRACYESGLRRNPSLEGRVAVKFVIDRAGAVNFASVSERDLPDDEVARCVALRFQDMTFPQPEGGIVTVVYPVVFTTN